MAATLMNLEEEKASWGKEDVGPQFQMPGSRILRQDLSSKNLSFGPGGPHADQERHSKFWFGIAFPEPPEWGEPDAPMGRANPH
jgi:hypothetical protein